MMKVFERKFWGVYFSPSLYPSSLTHTQTHTQTIELTYYYQLGLCSIIEGLEEEIYSVRRSLV